MADQPKRPAGKRFSHVYLSLPLNIKDSKELRTRVYGEFEFLRRSANNPMQEATDIGLYVTKELGSRVDLLRGAEFFENVALEKFLDAITIIHDFYKHSSAQARSENAARWRSQIGRVLREERSAYEMDESGGVHLRVDTAFQSERTIAVEALSSTRYSVPANFLEKAFECLDGANPQPRNALQRSFEAIEALLRLVSPRTTRLGSKEVREALRPILQERYADDATAKRVALRLIEGLCEWIEASHHYRHAPAGEGSAEPPEEVWHLLVSQSVSHIRWLAELDSAVSAQTR